MNTKALNQLADVICRAQTLDRTPMGIAFAVQSACLLQSPESAAELAQLHTDLDGARLSLWEEEQSLARAYLAARLARERAAELREALVDTTHALTKLRAGETSVSPWQRAVDGLNALVDADVTFHVEPDGHISNPFGDEHIEWDREAGRWRLVHDDEDAPFCRHASPYGRACDLDAGHDGDHGMSDGAGGHFGWPAEEPKHAAPCRWPASPDCTCADRQTSAQVTP
ncbi:hypothetical protein [Streptomyces altiplanensis]